MLSLGKSVLVAVVELSCYRIKRGVMQAFNVSALEAIIQQYEADINTVRASEVYKWEAAHCLAPLALSLAASNIFAKRPPYWTLRQYGGFLNIWIFSWCQAT